MAQQRQRAGAVVGQAQGHAGPAHPGAAYGIVHGVGAHHQRTLPAGKALQLGERHRVHAALRLCRALAQGEGKQAARAQQAEQLAQGAGPLGGHDMLPHGAEQDDVEGQPEAQRGGKIRQLVGDPARVGVGVPACGRGAQSRGGLDRHHVVPEPGEPSGVTAAAGAHVEHEGAGGREQAVEPAVQAFRRDCLVGVCQRGGPSIVPGCRIGRVGHRS